MSENTLSDSSALAVDPEEVIVDADADAVIEEGTEPAPVKPEPATEDKLQKRFDKLTKEKYEAQRERDRATWELEQLRAQAKTTPVAQEKPTLEGAGYDEAKYQQALIEYTTAAAEARIEKILADRDRQASVKAADSEFDRRQQEFAKSTPDYAAKVLHNQDLPITKEMANVIRKSDVGPNIAYYLADNEELAATIAKLEPMDQARELGRIEARLEAKATAKPSVSQAPQPPAKLSVGDSTLSPKTTDPTGDRLSDDEWFRAEKQRLASLRR